MDQAAAYIIEEARSGRSRCKTCRRAIAKGALRLGVLIEGPYGEGYMWHHLTCAARRRAEDVEAAYAAEAWNAAKQPPEKVPDLDELRRMQEQAEAKRASRRDPPYVELAPSGRSRCKLCGEPIDKGAPRVVLGRKVSFGNQERTTPVNVHPRCVAAELERDDAAIESDGLDRALRDGSEGVDPAVVERVIAEAGLAG